MESSIEINKKRSIDQVQDISADFDLSDCDFDDFRKYEQNNLLLEVF